MAFPAAVVFAAVVVGAGVGLVAVDVSHEPSGVVVPSHFALVVVSSQGSSHGSSLQGRSQGRGGGGGGW